MLEQPVLQLLRDCRAHLRRQLPFRATRALIQRIDGLLIAQREAARFGNTIVAQARSTAQLLNGVSIDEDESGVRSHPDGVQVRAWLLVPVEMIATIERADPALEIAFSRLDRKTRDVLMLSALQGLDVDQIATRLRISRRRVRQYLRQAIDAIADAVDPSEP